MAETETQSLCSNKANYASADSRGLPPGASSTAEYGYDQQEEPTKSANNQSKTKPQEQEIPYAIAPHDEALGDTHDKAMAAVGFGKLQWQLFVILGLGLMGDSIELLMIAYILPGAEKDLCMNAPMKGWLGGIAFAGMVFGAVIWGNMADRVGRKSTLITSLSINLVFAVVGAFMPTYPLFLVCRFFAGLGIGGSIPIVMAYYGEFCPREKRGWHVGMLLMFWIFGGVYVSAIGLIVIPNSEWTLELHPLAEFSSWRTFILICVLPVFLSAVGLLFMPESPRFLLQRGYDLEALAVYQQIGRTNFKTPPDIEIPLTSVSSDESQERRKKPEDDQPSLMESCTQFWDAFFCIFQRPLTMTSFVLTILWFCISFGYYGLSIWFPEYMKHIEQEHYFSKTNSTYDMHYSKESYTGLLDNIHYYNCTFNKVEFADIELRHIIFDRCFFENCQFINVTAKKTKFVDSFIVDSNFTFTNLYDDRFVDSEAVNVIFVRPQHGCKVDFDISYSQRKVFLETFICQFAVLPLTVLNAVLMDKFGRVRLLVGYLFLASLSVFIIWGVKTEVAVVVSNAIFSCLINGSFNSLDVATMELYPTNLRATAFGYLSCLGRIAAIIGNATFGNFIDVSKAIPVLVTASILAIGAVVGIKLPESKDKLL